MTEEKKPDTEAPEILASVRITDDSGNACMILGDVALVAKLAHALPHYHGDVSSEQIDINEDVPEETKSEALRTAKAWLDARGVPHELEE